jgi:hypothetical protein
MWKAVVFFFPFPGLFFYASLNLVASISRSFLIVMWTGLILPFWKGSAYHLLIATGLR